MNSKDGHQKSPLKPSFFFKSPVRATGVLMFERYQVWKSKTPGELVDELARKMVDIRCTRAYYDEGSKYRYGGVGPLG